MRIITKVFGSQICILATLFLSHEVLAMSVFIFANTGAFSGVSARLTIGSEPIANAMVSRQWEWNNRESDTAVTDENGYVEFPAVFESSISRLLPTELGVGQTLSVDISGN